MACSAAGTSSPDLLRHFQGRALVCPFLHGGHWAGPVWGCRGPQTSQLVPPSYQEQEPCGHVCRSPCEPACAVCGGGVRVTRVQEAWARPRRWRPCFSIAPGLPHHSRKGGGGQPPAVPPSPHPPAPQRQEPCALSPAPWSCCRPSGCPGLSPLTWSDPSKPSRRHGTSKGLEISRVLSPWWGLLSLKWPPRAQGGLSCAGTVTAATQTQTQPHPPGCVTALRGPRNLGVPGLNIPTNVMATAQLGPRAHPASGVRIPRPGSGPGLQPLPTSGPAGMQPPHCPACRGAWLRESRG